MTFVVDTKATKAARARHAEGVSLLLNAFFGWSPADAVVVDAERRRSQGFGGSSTQRHWSRPGRRRVAKAQRIARRRNRP